MRIRKAEQDDVMTALKIYEEGYVNATRSGVDIWERPSAESVSELMPGLYLVDMVRRDECFAATALHLSREPNRLVWGSVCEEENVLYLSKVAVSSNALGYLGVSRVFELIFSEFGEDTVLRWDIHSSNEGAVSFYEYLGASKIADHVFFSERRQAEVSVIKFEMSGSDFCSARL